MIISCCYRSPSGAIKGLNSFLENVFKKANTENKLSKQKTRFQSKMFRLQQKLAIQTFCNRIFAHGCIP